jgi:ribose transport system permease protein
MNNGSKTDTKYLQLRKFMFGGWGSLLLINLVFILIMAFASKAFLSMFNIFVVTRDVSTMVLIGFSQMVVLAIGQMNLSLGAIGGLAVIIAGGLMEVFNWPIWAALSTGLLVGILAGFINGFIIAKTGINSFIVTIASSS